MAEVSATRNILCKYFKLGICRNGSGCLYSHDEDVVNKVVPCKYYQRGTCAFGRNCRFDHVRTGSVAAGTAPERSGSKEGEKFTRLKSRAPFPVANSSKPKTDGDSTAADGHRSWADAPEFVPASARSGGTIPGLSYAMVAGGGGGNCAASSAGSSSEESDGSSLAGASAVDPNDELCPFALGGECRYGAACLYIHGLPCDLCGYLCLHPYNEDQRKQHRKECVARHEEDMMHSFEMAQSMDKTCGICYDVIMEKKGYSEQRFGILSSCNHVFCLGCIRKWRQQKENVVVPTKTARACPACRVPSDFVVPSHKWVEDKEEKAAMIKTYKDNMRKKPCKHFNFGEGECPFGNKCFYRHEKKDGTKVDVGPPKRRTRQNADGEMEILQQMLMWDFIDSSDLHRSFMMEMDFLSDTDDSDDDSPYMWGDPSDYEFDDFDYD